MATKSRPIPVPLLRFPEFRALKPWELRTIADVCERIASGGTPDTDRPEYWNGDVYWLTPSEMGKSFSPFVDSTSRTITRLGLESCSSELVPAYSVILTTRAPIGNLAINRVPVAINQGCRGLIPRSSLNHAFLFASLLRSTGQLNDLGAGNTFKELSGSSLKRFSIFVPERAEQDKIAACVTSLDAAISAQGRKIEALKTHKRGLIQQLFPVSGEAVPRLRFSGFKSPWQTRTLSDLLVERKQRNRSLTYGPGEVLSVSGEFGCVNQIELLGRSYAGVSVKDYHVVETGDLVYTKSPLKRNPYGIIKANKGQPGIVSTLYAVYRPTSLAIPAYLDHYFSRDFHVNSYLQPIVRKGAKNDMKVNNETVLTGEIIVPNVAEQAAIADFLDSIDATISIGQRAYSVLVEHKRALMHMLFLPAEKN